MAEENDDGKNRRWLIIAIMVIIVIVVIVLYYISFGKINLAKQEEEKKDKLTWLKNQLLELHYQKIAKEKIRKKRDTIVKWSFFYC